MKKKLAWILALALSVSMLGACGSSSSEDTSADDTETESSAEESAQEEEEETEDAEETAAEETEDASDDSESTELTEEDTTLRSLSVITAETFNPLVYGTTDKPINHALFDCLFKFDNDGNVVGMLAESWEEDGLEVTIHLREDVYFTDGNPLTADDVIFSYETTLEDPTLMYNMTMFSTGMEKVDDYTVRLYLVNTYCKWENFLAELLYIIEEDTYDPDADYTTTAPVGSGPYTLESVDAARTVTLTANEDYWGGAPEFKTVVVSSGLEDSTALIALQTGEIDLVTQIGLSAYSQAQEDENLTCVAFDSWSTMGLMIMVGDDAFREAIFHAIDRETIIAICNDGNGSPSTEYFSEKVMAEYVGVAPFTGYDVDLALECLAETSVDLSQTFEIQVFESTSADVAQCIISDLAAIGITAVVSTVDSNTWFENLTGGNMQMSITSMATDMVGLEDMVIMFDTESGGYPFSLSDEVLEMIRTAPYIEDDDERYAAMQELMEALNEACPWVPLYDTTFFTVYNSRVGGVNDCSPATYVYYFGDMTIEN